MTPDPIEAMTDLKPCPFCGGVAVFREADEHYRMVGCKKCDYGMASQGGFDIVHRWNRRAHDASETAALRKVRDEMAMAISRNILLPYTWLAALDAILARREK
jgi:Lar family restriction alleviation protein